MGMQERQGKERGQMKSRFVKRVLAVALALCMLAGGLPPFAGVMEVKASTNGHTREEAVAWANSQVNKDADIDGRYGAQCVDLIMAYYGYLGQRRASGHAKDYLADGGDRCPTGWSRYTTGQASPQPGDVVVFGANQYGMGIYGHIGIVVSVDGQSYNYIDFNGCGHNKSGYTCPQVICKDKLGGYGQIRKKSISQFSGLIRPDFPSLPPVPPEPDGRPLPEGAPQTISDGDYHIVSALEGNRYNPGSKCLTIGGLPGTKNTTGANASLWSGSGIEDFVFTVKWLGNGFYRIKLKYSDNQYLDVAGHSLKRGTNVWQWDYINYSAQQWQINETGDGNGYTIQSACNGWFLDVAGGKAADDANIWLWEGNGSLAQRWYFVPWGGGSKARQEIPDGEYEIVSKLDSNAVLSTAGNSVVSGTNLVLGSRTGTGKHTFNVTWKGGGYYEIAVKNTNLVFDVYNSLSKNGTNVTLNAGKSNNNINQRWLIKSCGGGYYSVISQGSGLCLDVHGGSTADGTNVEIFAGHGGNNQQWKFVPYKPAVEVSSITLDKTALTLKKDKTATLKTTILPANAADKTLTWESSDEAVATVDGSGLVTAKAKGTANITAKSANGKTASCQVTVEEVHVHEYKGEWQSDAGKHWKVCACGEKGQEAAHAFFSQSEGSVKREICSICGYVGKTIGGDEIPDTGFWAAPLEPQTYTGSAVKPELDVYFDGELLTERQDYSVSYQNNINARKADASSAPTVTVTGKGKYRGKLTLHFEIAPKDLSAGDVTASGLSASFDGRKKNPSPILSYRGKKLRAGKDYTIDYDECRAPGSYQVLIQGRGNYEGEKTLTFTVSGDRPASKMTVARIAAQSYQGSEVEPKPVVKDGGNVLTEGEEYTLSYRSNVKVGTASLIITGIPSGGYTGTKTVTYKIKPCSVKSAQIKVELEASYPLTPGGCKPEPVVTFQGKTLVEGEDYTLSYRNNKKASSVTSGKKAPAVVIKGRGNFGGSCERTFVITK